MYLHAVGMKSKIINMVKRCVVVAPTKWKIALLCNNRGPLRLGGPQEISKQPVAATVPVWGACSNHT